MAIVCGDDASRRVARPLQGIGERDGRYDAPTLPNAYRRIRGSAFGGGRIFKEADSVRFAGECSPRKLRDLYATAFLSWPAIPPVPRPLLMMAKPAF